MIDKGVDFGRQRSQHISDARDLREQLNKVETRIGEKYDSLPKRRQIAERDEKGRVVGSKTETSDQVDVSVEDKMSFRDSVGIGKDIAAEAVLIAKNPDIVKQTMDDSIEIDDVPNRSEIICTTYRRMTRSPEIISGKHYRMLRH